MDRERITPACTMPRRRLRGFLVGPVFKCLDRVNSTNARQGSGAAGLPPITDKLVQCRERAVSANIGSATLHVRAQTAAILQPLEFLDARTCGVYAALDLERLKQS